MTSRRPGEIIDMDGAGPSPIGSDAIAVGGDGKFLGKSVLRRRLHALEVDGESLQLASFEGADLDLRWTGARASCSLWW